MTLFQESPSAATETEREQAQALFEEARRRRRRWLISGITIVVLVIAAATTFLTVGGHTGGSQPKAGRPKPAPHVSAPAPAPVPTSTSTAFARALHEPTALGIAPNGGVLVVNQGSSQIIEREPSGALHVIAGNGRTGFVGDSGAATSAELDRPLGMAIAPDGTIYIADSGNNRVRAISPAGIITTVAQVPTPTSLAIGPDSTLYVVDGRGVQTIGSNGTVAAATAVVPVTGATPGGGINDLSVGGTPIAFDPDAIAVSASGDLYIANFSPKVLLQISPDGTASPVGGQSTIQSGGTYVTPAGLASDPDGSIVVADYGMFAIDRATGTNVTPVVTFRLNSVPGLEGSFRPSGVAVAPNGEIYADTDGANGGSNDSALIAIDPNGDIHVLAIGEGALPASQ